MGCDVFAADLLEAVRARDRGGGETMRELELMVLNAMVPLAEKLELFHANTRDTRHGRTWLKVKIKSKMNANRIRQMRVSCTAHTHIHTAHGICYSPEHTAALPMAYGSKIAQVNFTKGIFNLFHKVSEILTIKSRLKFPCDATRQTFKAPNVP